ncbi:MAG: hypothetical protein JO257_24095 [Deltaproteobacteria bacterium]|nr:hypothetical protein [Deltaproteobacteria bacterium]
MIERVTIVGPATRCFVRGPHHVVGSLAEMRAVLESMLGHAPHPVRMLDLLGHATRDLRVVRLGREAIDMFDPKVAQFFVRLAADRVLPRLGIRALRLLGCATATTAAGQRTMQRLARVLGMPVYGTTKPLMKSHFATTGFHPAFERSCLVEASQLTARRFA